MTPQWSKMTQHHLVIELHMFTEITLTRLGAVALAIIHREAINVSPRNHNFVHTSFELQLVNIGLKSRDIVLANIYRPPSSSKSVFLDEFGLLLTNLGTDAVDRLIICGDFNLPGTSPDTIDNGLAELLHSTSFSQFVKSPTRHDSHHDRSSLLDLIITPSSSKLVTVTSVVSSHEISDHDLTLTNLNTKRYKSPQRTYHYRNIKGINLELFEQSILSSSLFSSPDPTVDGFANQMETELTSIWDEVAPLKTGHRTGPRKAKNWLSPEAVDAKKQRRRLERRWKASNAEPDRLAYRAACSSANKQTSFAAANLERINEASKNPKRLWTTIKSILHSSPPNEQLSPPISQSLANSLASFFHQKIVSLKDSIALKLHGTPTPFDFDLPHSGEVLSDFSPVTPGEVSQLLKSIDVKQIITAWLHSHITSKIMCRHFLHPHLTPGKPIFHPGHFSFKIQTGTYLTPAKKTWFTKIGSCKLQADIQSEYHWRNPWASSPFMYLSTHFKISQFFSVTVCLSEISFHWDCLAQTNKWYNGIHWLW